MKQKVAHNHIHTLTDKMTKDYRRMFLLLMSFGHVCDFYKHVDRILVAITNMSYFSYTTDSFVLSVIGDMYSDILRC